jgi:myo-inositol-1(or 4)-monophosphatase
MQITSQELTVLQRSTEVLVRNVGNFTLKHWSTFYILSYKDTSDLVTDIDVKAERKLKDGLNNILSSAGFILEERENQINNVFNWIIDPIDQTKKFVGKIPLFTTQVGLLDSYNNCILGVVYSPVSRQLFSASRGNGTYLNEQKLFIKDSTNPKNSIIDINF